MKNLFFVLLVCCATGFIACETEDAHEHAEEAIDMTALRSTIQGMEDAYAAAQMAKDADGVVVYYADDAVSLAPDKPPFVGKDAILAMTKDDIAKDTARTSVKYDLVDLFAQGNLAVEVGKSTSTMKDGSTTTGKYMSVFENRNGKWVCIRDSYSDNAPEKSGE